MKPKWLRFNAACPDCGYVLTRDEEHVTCYGFTCPRCGTHYSELDFWRENHFKHGHENEVREEEEWKGDSDGTVGVD